MGREEMFGLALSPTSRVVEGRVPCLPIPLVGRLHGDHLALRKDKDIYTHPRFTESEFSRGEPKHLYLNLKK